MSEPRVILCERSGTWAAAMARCLPVGVGLRKTRGLDEAAAELDESSGDLLAVELTRQNLAAVLRFVAATDPAFPRARVAILAERGLGDLEWLFREAGAIYFTSSPRKLSELGDLACRHFSRSPAAPAESFTAQIWDALPWSAGVRT